MPTIVCNAVQILQVATVRVGWPPQYPLYLKREDVRDDQSDRGSVRSSGTPSVDGGGRKRGRGRGRGKARVKKPATPQASNTPRMQTRGMK